MKEYLNIVFTVVIMPLLPILTTYIVAFIKAKTKDLQNKNNNEIANKYIEIANDAICTAVSSTTQTYVDSLKKQNSFDLDAQKKAFIETKNKALSIMGVTAQNVLKETYDDIDAWIDNKIEFYIKNSK